MSQGVAIVVFILNGTVRALVDHQQDQGFGQVLGRIGGQRVEGSEQRGAFGQGGNYYRHGKIVALVAGDVPGAIDGATGAIANNGFR